MNSQKRLAGLREQFLKVIQEGLPYDLSVRTVERWDGPGPIPFADYRVEYEGDAAAVLRGVLNGDHTLSPLLRKLEFRILGHAPVLVVSLSRVVELSV